MTDDVTARLALPLLSAGQAQKELTHNEALALLDLFAQPVVVAMAIDTPPATPVPGQCWIVGDAPSGLWAGRTRHLAGWTVGGWRFCMPRTGMRVWNLADGCEAVFDGEGWSVGVVRGSRVEIDGVRVVAAQQSAIAAPVNGDVVDAEARAAIAAILAALQTHGLIAG
ncbi:DUF2793 domain-containing protein [Sphingomonas sp. H39-1-10]|uniref:DUF2793 domain-containing protein n=1 Tax=Sphingomonas pollutisoli TaxID=3030829 RepID=UPI0023B941E1|nr:DUF2793 domain-containing protein [Sphingomonas pollutisoli]MDF0486777.1 DUF2793 domain-containing protein [Sphingomonas pollutisoli]